MKNNNLKQAVLLLKAGNRVEALQLLSAYLKQHSGDADGWYLLGFALQDRQKKIRALKRSLDLKPDHLRAAQLLQKLKGGVVEISGTVAIQNETESKKKPAKEKRKKKSVRVPKWAYALVIIVLIFSAVGVFAWMNAESIQATLKEFSITSTATQTSPPTITFTPVNTLPGTWTATPPNSSTKTPVSTQTPWPTAVPTATSTVLPFAPDVQAEITKIQKEVSALRGLGIREEVYTELMPVIKLRMMLYELFVDEEMLAGLDDEEIALKAFGFMDENYDLTEAALEDFADYLGGFYLPENNSLFVIGTSFRGNVQHVYSHEYMHALQDQHFDLTSLGIYPVCTRPQQECLAIRALVEGEASYVMDLWWGSYAGSDDYNSYKVFTPPSPLFSPDPPPPYFGMDGAFAYSVGAYFVAYLHQFYGWEAVNAAYTERLPITTEQILFPEKYIENELPVPVDDPLLGDVLGDGWRLVLRDSMGLWESFLLLGYGNAEESQLPMYDSIFAVEAWAGDTYQVYYHDERQETVMVVHWVWDTEEAQELFFESLDWSLEGRFDSNSAEGTGACWGDADWVSCLYAAGTDSLWIITSSSDLTNLVSDEFPQFK